MDRSDERAGTRAASPPREGDEAGSDGTGTDDETVLAVLAHVVPFPFEVAFFFVAADSELVRYHAAHSLAYSLLAPVVLLVLMVVATLVSFAVPLVAAVLGLGIGLLSGDAGTGLTVGFTLGAVAFSVVPMVALVVVPVVLLLSMGIWAYFVVAAVGGRRPRMPVVSRVADAIQRVATNAVDGRGHATGSGGGVRRG